MAPINISRTSSDSVQLRLDDEANYLSVQRSAPSGKWVVRRVTSVTSTQLHTSATADDAIDFAKGYLLEGRDDLDNALKDAGF